jgi:cobalt-zinc-cadmium efflux system membrane fusion protein
LRLISTILTNALFPLHFLSVICIMLTISFLFVRLFAVVVVFTAIIGVSSCSRGDSDANGSAASRHPAQVADNDLAHHAETSENADIIELNDEQMRTAGMELGRVEMKVLSEVLKVNGVLDAPPQNVVSVSPRIGGYIRSIRILQGSRVRRGETLAILEHQDIVALQQEYLENRSRLDLAEAEFQRQQTLRSENINAAKTFEQVSAERRILQARLAGLRRRLQLIGVQVDSLRPDNIDAVCRIVSPINGYVTEVNGSLGSFLSPNDVLCRIINTEHLHAELTVFEADAPLVRVGQSVRLRLSGETRERLAKVYLIGREISSARTLRVHAHLEEEDQSLTPNTAFSALIELGEKRVPAVPESAVVSANGKNYIFIAKDNEKRGKKQVLSVAERKQAFQMVEVRQGATAGGWTEIIASAGGELSSAKIVVRGAYALISATQTEKEE